MIGGTKTASIRRGMVTVVVLAALAGCSGGDRSGPPQTFLEALELSPFLPREARLDLRGPDSEGDQPA